MLEEVEVGGRSLIFPAIVPKLSATRGTTDWPGPPVGAHNREVLNGLLGLGQDEMDRLEREGIL
jgi:crotonobetainyl-CoA:carnitine CoA-transferase CaiB-like acyl-CoA transferase